MVIDGVLDIRPQMGSPHYCEEEEKHWCAHKISPDKGQHSGFSGPVKIHTHTHTYTHTHTHTHTHIHTYIHTHTHACSTQQRTQQGSVRKCKMVLHNQGFGKVEGHLGMLVAGCRVCWCVGPAALWTGEGSGWGWLGGCSLLPLVPVLCSCMPLKLQLTRLTEEPNVLLLLKLCW